ncbi:YtzI protein [Oceanobacillus rekensis]|uniref:YtzI protein n=1 Tax=Oceanobacillus rekensis TaxID=937927 RepID=UPI000B451239|nr:YtzI protein [Oceanobacillus rekensis]
MGTYLTVGIVSLVFVGMVVALSLVTLSKGYGYKHSVDSLPDNDKEEDIENGDNKKQE